MPITGECFCGKIKYSIDGKLRDARSCHCSRCRKAFSSQASAYADVDADDFKWIQGEDLLTTYMSNGSYGLQFCSQCGSALCGLFEGRVHGITLGCLNEDPEIEIGVHIYVGSKAAWEVLPDNVVKFEEGAPTST